MRMQIIVICVKTGFTLSVSKSQSLNGKISTQRTMHIFAWHAPKDLIDSLCFENRNIQESQSIPDDDETLVKPVESIITQSCEVSDQNMAPCTPSDKAPSVLGLVGMQLGP